MAFRREQQLVASLERRVYSVRSPAEEGKQFEEVRFCGRFVEVVGVVDDADALSGEVVEEVAEEGDGGRGGIYGAVESREGGCVDTLADRGKVGV